MNEEIKIVNYDTKEGMVPKSLMAAQSFHSVLKEICGHEYKANGFGDAYDIFVLEVLRGTYQAYMKFFKDNNGGDPRMRIMNDMIELSEKSLEEKINSLKLEASKKGDDNVH